jgi:hypothetical protein
MTPGREALALGLLALAVPALALIGRLPSHPIIFGVLNDAAHAPVFAVQAWLLLKFLQLATGWSRPVQCGAAFVLAVTTGAVVELVQPILGRGAEWRDLLTDAMGAALGLALAAWHGAWRGKRLWATLAVLLGLAICWPVVEAAAGYALRAGRFPELFWIATTPDRYFLRVQGASGVKARLPQALARPGDPDSLAVRIAAGHWPGIALIEPEPDWSAYDGLVLDLSNPADEALALVLRVHDRRHDNQPDDRFNARIVLAPGQRSRLEFPLAQIAAGPAARTLDLSAIAGVILYADQGPSAAGRTFYVTRIRLE